MVSTTLGDKRAMRRSRELRIYLISWLTDFAYMMFIFAVTRRMAENGATLLQLGIVGGATSFSYGIGGTIAGHLSDRWGRRKLATSGAIGQALVYVVCTQWQSQFACYLMTGLAGVSAGLFYPPVIAWLTEGNHQSQQRQATVKTLFRFCLAWNLGVICGQTAGGWLFSINYTMPIVGSIFLMIVVVGVVLAWPQPPGSKVKVATSGQLNSLVPLPQARTFVYLGWTANVAGALAMSLIFYLFPYLAENLGISAPIHGIMLAMSRLTIVLTYLLMHYVTFWQYRLSTSLLSQFCAMSGLVLLMVGRTVPVLTAGLMLVAVLTGYNYFASIFYSTTGFADHQKGIATGIHEASLALGFGLGALGGGFLGVWLGSRIPYLACLVVLAVSALAQVGIYLALRRRWASVELRA